MQIKNLIIRVHLRSSQVKNSLPCLVVFNLVQRQALSVRGLAG